MQTVKVPYEQLEQTFADILTQKGLDSPRASLAAELFAKASLDGVASHGLSKTHFLGLICYFLIQVGSLVGH
ncbi:MAG TPA: hypothetical protein VK014_00425 [Cyclobacteriaceae bacterium]|nr:hypothetical protein [Cyclobacteriaceae bacterium]